MNRILNFLISTDEIVPVCIFIVLMLICIIWIVCREVKIKLKDNILWKNSFHLEETYKLSDTKHIIYCGFWTNGSVTIGEEIVVRMSYRELKKLLKKEGVL